MGSNPGRPGRARFIREQLTGLSQRPSCAEAAATDDGNPTRQAQLFPNRAPCQETTVRYRTVISDAACTGRHG